MDNIKSGNYALLKYFNINNTPFYYEHADVKHWLCEFNSEKFNHGLLINTKYTTINKYPDSTDYSFDIRRLGDLFVGIVVDSDKLKYINHIKLEIGGYIILTIDKYCIKGSIKKIKVFDTINNIDKIESIITLLDIPIALLSLQYHKVKITINTTKPIKYIDIVYYLFNIGRLELLSHPMYYIYTLSNKSQIYTIIANGMWREKVSINHITDKFYISDINKIISIQKLWKAKIKLKKLRLLKEIIDTSDKLLYKPGNLKFMELKQKYKGIFLDC